MARAIVDRTMSALRKGEAHAKGEQPDGMVVSVPGMVDIAGIRKHTGKTQPAFAASIGVPVSTLRQWEHQRRQPQGPARVLLAMLERNPHLVEETLGVPA